MAIEGLRQEDFSPIITISADEAAAVSVEALNILGLVEDKDQALESIATGYQSLVEFHLPGRPYMDIPYSAISTADLVRSIDAITEGPATYVQDNIWVPGTRDGSYTDEQLARASGQVAQARLALYSDHPQEPLLHFTNQPFDNEYAEEGQRTQLESVERAIKAFETEYTDRTMQALGHRAILLIALEHRIKGEPNPLRSGFMYDATLPRPEVYGGLYSGYVFSRVNQLRLCGSVGGAGSSSDGVGLSVGLKEEA